MKFDSFSTQSLLAIALFCFCLAIIVCFVSNNIDTRFAHRQEAVAQQFAILEGRPYLVDGQQADWPPFRSRVLFPALLAAISHWKIVPPEAWFVILRIATAAAAFFIFALLLIEVSGASLKLAAAGCIWLALGLILTFNHSWEHPTDFPDVIFFALALWFSVRRKSVWLAAATILATLNHQTAAFAGVLWICLHGFDPPRTIRVREIAFGGLLVAASRATSWFVEYLIRGQADWSHIANGHETIDQFVNFLRHPYAAGWPVLLFALVVPTSLWIWINRHSLDRNDRRILIAVAITVGISSVIAFMQELRSVFLAPHVMATFVAANAEARTAHRRLLRHVPFATPPPDVFHDLSSRRANK